MVKTVPASGFSLLLSSYARSAHTWQSRPQRKQDLLPAVPIQDHPPRTDFPSARCCLKSPVCHHGLSFTSCHVPVVKLLYIESIVTECYASKFCLLPESITASAGKSSGGIVQVRRSAKDIFPFRIMPCDDLLSFISDYKRPDGKCRILSCQNSWHEGFCWPIQDYNSRVMSPDYKSMLSGFNRGVRTFSWTIYQSMSSTGQTAISPRLLRYWSGLIPPSETLILFSEYQCIYSSRMVINFSMVTSFQERP